MSAGLAVAPEKDWNSCHNLTVQNTESEDLSLRVIRMKGFKVESKAGNQMPKKLSSRASMFHGMLETFGFGVLTRMAIVGGRTEWSWQN